MTYDEFLHVEDVADFVKSLSLAHFVSSNGSEIVSEYFLEGYPPCQLHGPGLTSSPGNAPLGIRPSAEPSHFLGFTSQHNMNFRSLILFSS
jgi:hypothetical protein